MAASYRPLVWSRGRRSAVVANYHPPVEHEQLTPDQQLLFDEYVDRLPKLEQLRKTLEENTRNALDGLPHIDRISFRVKDKYSFVRKCHKKETPYSNPLVQVEDQVAGRVLVFFYHDLSVVEEKLEDWFTGIVEAKKKRPEGVMEFGYESNHFIIGIDEHLKPPGWEGAGQMPVNFELQIRTLFMHAWAEPQHDLDYKGKHVPGDYNRRMLAWIASSAWGADRMFEDVWKRMTDSETDQ